MLVQRVLTALVLLPLLLALVWYAPPLGIYAAFTAIAAIVAWEWSGLIRRASGLLPPALRGLYAAATAGLMALVWFLPARAVWLPWLLGAACLWWLLAPAVFHGFPGNLQRHAPPALGMGLLGWLLIVSTMLALAQIHGHADGALRLLYVLFLVFAADTGAFLTGRNLGRHKLAPAISPGKTVEGAIGGMLLCGAWALTAGMFVFKLQGMAQILSLLALSMLAAAASIVGDLAESMFKRHAGVKDSGTILPGHGGMLDRLDSILAAAPVMALGLGLLKL
ncbi:MAG TPA: phosphatidate cytidylyltransferase [Fontimonas sp.]